MVYSGGLEAGGIIGIIIAAALVVVGITFGTVCVYQAKYFFHFSKAMPFNDLYDSQVVQLAAGQCRSIIILFPPKSSWFFSRA